MTIIRNLHKGCTKIKKRVTMKEAHILWGNRDSISKIEMDSINRLEEITCKSGFKILIIEDDLTLLFMLKHLLNNNKFYNIIEVSSLEESVKIIEQNDIDLILRDHRIDIVYKSYTKYLENVLRKRLKGLTL